MLGPRVKSRLGTVAQLGKFQCLDWHIVKSLQAVSHSNATTVPLAATEVTGLASSHPSPLAYLRHGLSQLFHGERFKWQVQRKAAKAWQDLPPVDLVIGHDVFGLPAARAMAEHFGAPLVCDLVETVRMQERSGQYYRTMPRWGQDVLDQRHRRIIKNANCLWTVGPSLADHLAEQLGVPRPGVLPNSHSLQSRQLPQNSGDDAPSARRQDGLTRLAYVNLLAPGYGLDQLLDVLARVKNDPAQVGTCELLLIGKFTDQQFEAEFWERARRLDVAQMIEYHQPMEWTRFIDVLATADLGLILLDPAIANFQLALPNRYFDFLSAGLPMISTRVSDIARFAEQIGHVALIDEMSADALHQCLGDLLATGEIASMSQQVSKARQSLDWQQAFERVLSHLEDRHGLGAHVAIVARKDLYTNRRVAAQAQSLRQRGIDVTCLFQLPDLSLKTSSNLTSADTI